MTETRSAATVNLAHAQLTEDNAVICLEDRAIFHVARQQCPLCAGRNVWPIARWLSARRVAMIVYACLTPECDYEFTDNLTGEPVSVCPTCGGREFIAPPEAKRGFRRALAEV